MSSSTQSGWVFFLCANFERKNATLLIATCLGVNSCPIAAAATISAATTTTTTTTTTSTTSSTTATTTSTRTYVQNGDFETGAASPWDPYWAAPLVVAETYARTGSFGVLSSGRTASWMGPSQVRHLPSSLSSCNTFLPILLQFCLSSTAIAHQSGSDEHITQHTVHVHRLGEAPKQCLVL
jgi:hypothetical protein